MATDVITQLEKARNRRDLSVFDVTSIDNLSDSDIKLLLELAEIFKKAKTQKLSLLKNKTIINAFYENSTRTRLSFELAGKHLGADTVNISASGSSAKKGESLLDTTLTLTALQACLIIVRSENSGASELLARHVPASIINAGDGWHEHPSQGLLDAKTMLDHHKKLTGKIITVVGDILHSRVFGSLVRISTRLGAHVQVACPRTFLPENIEQFGVKYFPKVEEALKDADVVYALRVQEERGAAGDIPSIREYSKTFGISSARFDLAKKDAILMHPGPVIRDTDVSSTLMTHERCKILTQVENGLAIRKALLWLLADRQDTKQKSFLPA